MAYSDASPHNIARFPDPQMTAYFDRFTHPAGAPNAFSQLFDEMPGVDHVREWLKKDPQQI
jgi:hypothetical protein